MNFSSKSLAGPGFIILNVIRGFNIICLLSVIASSVVMIVKTITISKFFFFDAATNVVTASSSMLLLVSECSIFKGYFLRVWPVLSPRHGFNFLGLAMIVLGNNTLGNLNKDATSQQSMGMALWRLVIGSGIVVFVFGVVNIIANYIFRDAKLGVTARQVRAKGAVAISEGESAIETEKLAGHTPSIVSSFPTGSSIYSAPTPRKSPVKTFLRTARDSLLPSYHSRTVHYTTNPVVSDAKSPTTTRHNNHNNGPRSPTSPMQISAPLNVNPQFAHLIKPQLAHHPSNRRPDGSF